MQTLLTYPHIFEIKPKSIIQENQQVIFNYIKQNFGKLYSNEVQKSLNNVCIKNIFCDSKYVLKNIKDPFFILLQMIHPDSKGQIIEDKSLLLRLFNTTDIAKIPYLKTIANYGNYTELYYSLLRHRWYKISDQQRDFNTTNSDKDALNPMYLCDNKSELITKDQAVQLYLGGKEIFELSKQYNMSKCYLNYLLDNLDHGCSLDQAMLLAENPFAEMGDF